jgi:hypothetical protein
MTDKPLKKPLTKPDVLRLRLSPKMKVAVEKRAAMLDKSMSEYIRYLIENDLKK